MVMKSSIFRDITPSACHLLSRWFLAWLILRPWRWRQHVPSKRRLTFNGLHGVISQKIELFNTNSDYGVFSSLQLLRLSCYRNIVYLWITPANICKPQHHKTDWMKQTCLRNWTRDNFRHRTAPVTSGFEMKLVFSLVRHQTALPRVLSFP
jgi:hypothetical protein